MTGPSGQTPDLLAGDAATSLSLTHLVPLAAATALALLAAVAVGTLLEPISEYPGYLTQHENVLTVTAVTLAAVLSLLVPLWRQRAEERALQRRDYWSQVRRRMAEAVTVLAAGVPFLLAAALVSGLSLWRAGEVVVGLIGTAALAVAWRTVLVGGYRLLRQAAVLDLLLTTLGPVVLGYVLLEGTGADLGWLWRISPLAVAADVSRVGLTADWAAFWIGTVGYLVAGMLILVLVRPLMPPRDEPSQTNA